MCHLKTIALWHQNFEPAHYLQCTKKKKKKKKKIGREVEHLEYATLSYKREQLTSQTHKEKKNKKEDGEETTCDTYTHFISPFHQTIMCFVHKNHMSTPCLVRVVKNIMLYYRAYLDVLKDFSTSCLLIHDK
jgi:hypothetical protein